MLKKSLIIIFIGIVFVSLKSMNISPNIINDYLIKLDDEGKLELPHKMDLNSLINTIIYQTQGSPYLSRNKNNIQSNEFNFRKIKSLSSLPKKSNNEKAQEHHIEKLILSLGIKIKSTQELSSLSNSYASDSSSFSDIESESDSDNEKNTSEDSSELVFDFEEEWKE